MHKAVIEKIGTGRKNVMDTIRSNHHHQRRYSLSIFLLLLWHVTTRIMAAHVVVVESKLIAAAVIPHGDIALDPTFLKPNTPARRAGDEIAKASREAGYWFSTHHHEHGNEHENGDDHHDFDVVFLSTPHGIQLTHDYGIYLGHQASGSINITGDLPYNKEHPPYTVSMSPIQLEKGLSLELVMNLTNKDKNKFYHDVVSGIETSADDSQDMPLEWAEIIPLMLLPKKMRHSHSYILWSYPLRRYTESFTVMVPELLAIGTAIRNWMEEFGNKIKFGVLISGDMSHTHQATSPYGYSNTSALFDKNVGIWATNPCDNADYLLQRARSLQSHALSCGFTGFILLHGMMCGDSNNDNDHSGSKKWDRLDNDRVFVNQNATYYGMMAATFDSSPSSTAAGSIASL